MAKPPISAFPPLLFLSPPSPNPNADTKISPSILIIIIILAIIFFVSGLLHLLVRCLLRPTSRVRDPDPDPTALQGQLRQLFNLHDGGVDQSFIDTLPVFAYKAILGVKDPFDCAVCLCEFEFEDKLRLLPKCSHAFHVHCIDTWLLSHSTCPLCRFSLLHGFNGVGVPFVCVLESSRDLGESMAGPDSEEGLGLGFGSGRASEVGGKGKGDRVVSVKLGKFRNVDGGEGSSADTKEINNDNNNHNHNHNLGGRRCYSMGSFAYVLDEKTSLRVPITTPSKKKRMTLSSKPSTMSEYGSDSMRKFQLHSSFSISRIWMRGDKGIQKGNHDSDINVDIHQSGLVDELETKSCYSVESLSKKSSKKTPTSSFRELQQENTSGRSKRESFSISKGIRNDSRTRPISEIEMDESELGLGGRLSQRFGAEETQSCSSVDSSLVNLTSSTSTSTSNNRTLLWLMGRHNKLLHNNSLSFSSNL